MSNPSCDLPKLTQNMGQTPHATPNNKLVADYQNWLRNHRGVVEATITEYSRAIMQLLPDLGCDPAKYDASLVRRIIIGKVGISSSNRIQFLATVLRGYLRFLVARGICQPGIDEAIPAIAQWRLSSLPLYLPPADVEKLIMACDQKTPTGIRDHAILLFLARLGLRSGDILTMCLGDIDWECGTLLVCGKGRREVRLPLPQDAGDALLTYLTKVRPNTGGDRVFLSSRAPFRPFEKASAIWHVVNSGLERAGIIDAPSRGANLLRHSAATTMLRSGLTLDAIGTILRHRSLNTTAHYAKVDIPTLRKVVQSWPGDESC
jgi:integrase/recombinase XerD